MDGRWKAATRMGERGGGAGLWPRPTPGGGDGGGGGLIQDANGSGDGGGAESMAAHVAHRKVSAAVAESEPRGAPGCGRAWGRVGTAVRRPALHKYLDTASLAPHERVACTSIAALRLCGTQAHVRLTTAYLLCHHPRGPARRQATAPASICGAC